MLRWLFGRRTRFVISGVHVGDGSHGEPKEDCDRRFQAARQDPSALYRRKHGPLASPGPPSTEPICPYCGQTLGKRKPPQRCSSFMHKACGNRVYVDPRTFVFRSVYQTVDQAVVASGMDCMHLAGFASTEHDYWHIRLTLGLSPDDRSVESVAKALRALAAYNRANLRAINAGDTQGDNAPFLRKDMAAAEREVKAACKGF